MKRSMVITAAVCASLVLASCSKPNPINQANFDKITNGMSIAEVEALLGGKGMDKMGKPMPAGGKNGVLFWRIPNENVEIMVTFKEDKMTEKHANNLK